MVPALTARKLAMTPECVSAAAVQYSVRQASRSQTAPPGFARHSEAASPGLPRAAGFADRML